MIAPKGEIVQKTVLFPFWTPLRRARLCPNCDAVFDSSYTYCPRCGAQHLHDTLSLVTIIKGEKEEAGLYLDGLEASEIPEAAAKERRCTLGQWLARVLGEIGS